MIVKKKVCMFVYNNFLNDSRVEKEAQTLIKAGYQVTVIALLDASTKHREDRNHIHIIRVKINPWHQRLIRWVHSSINILKYFFHLFLMIGVIEFLYYSKIANWVANNKISIYSIFIVFFASRQLVFGFVKRVKRFVSKKNRRIQRLIVNSLKHFLMPFHRQFCFFSFYINAYKFTVNEKFDIFHAHDLNTLPVAYFSAKRNMAKLVYDSHELYIERNKLKPSSKIWKFFLRHLEGFLIQQADAVFTVNNTLAGELAKRYKISTPGVVMNTPASITTMTQCLRFNGSLRSELSISAQYKLIIYVGAITFNRGLEELIQSLQYLTDCYLAYMGYGNEQFKKGLLDLAEEINVSNRFSFYGPVPSEQVIYYASDADIGAAPIANCCLSYYYCSPNKLFEYMNAGLPVVASNFPELEKVVIGHEIGTTFNPADPQDIAKSIRQILDDPPTREKMAKNADRASRLYNWENESKKLIQLYSRM